MLKSLYISSFVIIDEMQVDFHEGMSVLTGETGAGKSIIIDAIGCSDKAFAFFAKKTNFLNTYCMNENPHITLATYNGGKPVDSNKINNFIALDNPIEIVGNR